MNGGHRLDPLLNPRSVALVGASPRADSVGNWMLETFLAGGYAGELYLVNPNYETIGDHSCYPSLTDLPEAPDMALLNVGSARMEALFEEAIGVGVRSLTLFDYCMLEGDTEPKLLDRLKGRARDADIPVCGGGGMGLYNFDARVHASFLQRKFDRTRAHRFDQPFRLGFHGPRAQRSALPVQSCGFRRP